MLSVSFDQSIQNYNTCEDYIRSSKKLQHLLTCRRKRQMLRKITDSTPQEAGTTTTTTTKRSFPIKRPHLAPNLDLPSTSTNIYDYDGYYSQQHKNDDTSIGVRNNKMMKLKHAGFQEFDKHINYKQYQQSSTPKQVQSSRQLEKYIKQSISSSNDDSKHLVKSISDLPVFVTIEGFRVASYSISGEPYLCLPQLLQFLKRYFSINRLIAKFEESFVTFPSATPKQVEGFVKSSVLPSNATSCPLIKRSDADKICLGLYEQCSKAMRSDIVKLCSQKTSNFSEGSSNKVPSKITYPLLLPPPITTTTIALQNSIQGSSHVAKSESSDIKNSENTSQISSRTNDDNTKSDSDILSQSCNTKNVNLDDNESNRPVNFNTSTFDQQLNTIQPQRQVSIIKGSFDFESKLAKSDNDGGELKQISTTGTSLERSCKSDSEINKKPLLFESEAQNSILSLARDITSTLIIRVYHKCFGKCLGLYYPSLLSNCNSKCIECASCKIMLSPRRFIGHTHGSKENDVCHWGFDSYNWRCYIRLSRKQTQNNLDDDELLIKFRTLLSVPDDDTNENDSDDYEFDKQESDENYGAFGDRIKETKIEPHVSSNLPTNRQLKRKYTASSLTPMIADTSYYNKTALSQVLGSSSEYERSSTESSSSYFLKDPPMYLPSPDKVDLCSAKSSLGISLPPVSIGLASDVMQPIYVHHQASQSQQPQQQVVPLPPSASQQLALPPEYYNFPWSPLAEQARQVQQSIYSPSFSGYRDRSQLPTAASRRSSSFSTSNVNTYSWSPSRSTSVAGPANMLDTDQITRQLSLDSEIKREIYICNNLTPYLGDKGLSTGLINDIVETTLNIVRRSKTLF